MKTYLRLQTSQGVKRVILDTKPRPGFVRERMEWEEAIHTAAAEKLGLSPIETVMLDWEQPELFTGTGLCEAEDWKRRYGNLNVPPKNS